MFLEKRHYLKLFGFWAVFLTLHYAYDFWPILPIKLISGVDESFFQHAKIAFFAYLFVNLIEYLVRRKGIEYVESFIMTRLFSTTILPWFVFVIWFTAPAYYGPFANVSLEILFANIALILSGLCALVVEQTMKSVVFHNLSKVVIVSLFLISLSLYIIFTFKQPWVDFFAEPVVGVGNILVGLFPVG